MYGAILGDIIGSIYERESDNIKTKDFPLFSSGCTFTDDSVMTLAVGKAILSTKDKTSSAELTENFIKYMQKYGRAYPNAGYGGNFIRWIMTHNPQPYGSFGNGSAMRVSSAAWLFDNMEDVLRCAALSAAVSHNHPEGIKGACCTAAAIFLARTGSSKAAIKRYIEENFGYDLSFTCDEIRPVYRFDVSCMGTVPPAVVAFLESTDFEDCIRNAVSLGGDCDTLTAISASIAEGFYGVPENLKDECRKRLPREFTDILDEFDKSLAV